MMTDFTVRKYAQLLDALIDNNYQFLTVEQYATQSRLGILPERFAIMRHDVDLLPQNSYTTAVVEAQRQIKATYYFRIVNKSNNPAIIKDIANLGHEIGYHYEDLTTCKGDKQAAFESFKGNLEYFRQYYPVRTVCMHGSPTSKFDSKDIWTNHSYADCGIIAEPYLDFDYTQLFYLTDTGRRWDGYRVSRRDGMKQQAQWRKQGLTYHTTDQIIAAINNNTLPHRVLFTTHPQRWTNNKLLWLRELLTQSAKNVVKLVLT